MLFVSCCSIPNEYEIRVGIFKFGCTPPGTSNAFVGTGAAGLIGSPETGNAAML